MSELRDRLNELSPDLYCITDAGIAKRDDAEQVEEMIVGGAKLIQLRNKSAVVADLVSAAKRCRERCGQAGVLFIVNDNIEVAAMVGADGVHLGQDDALPSEARTMLGEEFLIGISTHNRDQLVRAIDEPVDYIALGPIYGTTTKANPDPAAGVELAKFASELLAKDGRPLVLIGGINRSNLQEITAAAPGALYAVIGGVLNSESIADAVKSYRESIRQK